MYAKFMGLFEEELALEALAVPLAAFGVGFEQGFDFGLGALGGAAAAGVEPVGADQRMDGRQQRQRARSGGR